MAVLAFPLPKTNSKHRWKIGQNCSQTGSRPSSPWKPPMAFKGELAVSFRGGSLAMFQGYSVHRDAVSLLALRIATGRRHQIRIHLAAIGRPTFNDALYLGDLSGLQMSKKIHPKFRFDPKKLSWQCLDTYHIKLQFYIHYNIQKRTQSGYGKTGIGQPDMESARQNIQLRTANWV